MTNIENKEEPMAFTDHKTGKRYTRSLDGNSWVEVKNEDQRKVREEDDGTR